MNVVFAAKRVIRARVIAPGLLALAASALPALAQGTAEERQACTPDVFRLCSSEIPNVDRIVACLNREHARLSPGCRAVMAGDARASGKTRAARSDR